MTMPLDPASALAAISDQGLEALRSAAAYATGPVPGLLAYVEHAAGWEVDRRPRHALPAARPGCGDRPKRNSMAGLAALTLLAQRFRMDGVKDNDAVADFLTVTADVLHAEFERPNSVQ
jgi:hypothetical protein